jgi:hypothetical protein
MPNNPLNWQTKSTNIFITRTTISELQFQILSFRNMHDHSYFHREKKSFDFEIDIIKVFLNKKMM